MLTFLNTAETVGEQSTREFTTVALGRVRVCFRFFGPGNGLRVYGL